ncbi:hypothetical protein QBC44DRAFT_294686 [Cladorrhinum sp. PSN332]|nr:hypothetical protein QBC44DRAFT_294686 [Cladorrhinum sp. PSN332]
MGQEGLAPAASAAIRGSNPQGIPLGPSEPLPSTSAITDLGDQVYWQRTDSLGSQNSANSGSSVESAPTSLRNKLSKARVLKPWSNNMPTNGFVPKPLLHRLITPDVVTAELTKPFERAALRRLLKTFNLLPSNSLSTQQQEDIRKRSLRICGNPTNSRVDSSSNQHKRASSHGQFRENHNMNPPPADKTFRKILAILLLMGQKKERIHAFIDEDVSDADLPLAVADPVSVTSTTGKARKSYQLRRKKDPETRLKCFKGWKVAEMEKFENWQWSVLSPYFGRDSTSPRKIPHYVLPNQAILPFLDLHLIDSRGGSSEVYKAAIHCDHHDFKEFAPRQPTTAEACDAFAVKRLKPQMPREQFKKEVGILEIINKSPHDHVITLLVTYEQHERHHLVFPLAKYDLIEYWKSKQTNHMPHNDEQTAQWLAEQCQGLASGLQQIHRILRTSSSSFESAACLVRQSVFPAKDPLAALRMLFCRHGDIKPKNILLFADVNEMSVGRKGILKITDFGAAEFGEVEAVPQKALPFTPAYQPPEAGTRGGKGVMSTSYDIWGLGCLFLEFATWCFGGWDYIEEFETNRMEPDLTVRNNRLVASKYRTPTFFRLTTDSAGGEAVPEIKDSVRTFIRDLHNRRECTEFFHDFLEMVEREMLVIDHKDRMTAREVERELDSLREKARSDREYFRTAAGRGAVESAATTVHEADDGN